MAEATGTTGTMATGEAAGTTDTGAVDEALGAPGLKALQAERDRASSLEAALKALQGGGDAVAAATAAAKSQRDAETALAAARTQLQEFEDKGKTEEQKRTDTAAKLASERDTATVKALRYEVCADKDLPLAAARFLTGATKAEIEEAADAFKSLGIGSAVAGRTATGLPASPNAGRDGRAPSGAEAGLAEARKRFPQLATKA